MGKLIEQAGAGRLGKNCVLFVFLGWQAYRCAPQKVVALLMA